MQQNFGFQDHTSVFHCMLVYLNHIKENTLFIFCITYTINTRRKKNQKKTQNKILLLVPGDNIILYISANHQIFSYSSSYFKICMLNKITGKEKNRKNEYKPQIWAFFCWGNAKLIRTILCRYTHWSLT